MLAVGAVSDREKPRPDRNTKHLLGMIAVGDRSYRGRDGFAVGDRSYRGNLEVYFFNPCSLAKALAMAEPAPAAGGEV